MSEPVPAAYHEPARTYISAVWFALLLIAGFCFDLVLGGGIAHIPGWIIAFVLVVGIDAFVVWAARSTHSLDIDDTTVRVGDEAVNRAEIISAHLGVDRTLPVLGWRGGLPRGAKGVTLRLFDDQEVVVPTRHPQRVGDLLGVNSVPRTVDVRAADTADLSALAEIYERAQTLFRAAGYVLPAIEFDAAGPGEAAAVFVAGSPPVAFVQVDEVDGHAHVAELAAVPGSMRQGIGGRLLEQACTWAREATYGEITLITYADVPWNGPFYARHGFAEVAAYGRELTRRRRRQTALGLDEVGRRVVMRRVL